MYNHLLDTFILVADEKSINKASEKLFISPVSVMKQIRKLEEEFEVKLFYTTNKGCELSEDGIKFYKAAKDIIDYSNKLIDELKHKRDITLRLGISFLNNCDSFFDKWSQIEKSYKDIKINILSIEENRLSLNSLDSGKVDMLVNLYDFYEDPEFEYIQIGHFQQVVLVPVKHNLSHKKVIKMPDLNNTSIYVPKANMFPALDELVKKIKANNSAVNLVETKNDVNIEKILNDCVNNNALFFATDSLDNKHPGLVAIPLEFGKDVPYCLFYTRKLLREHPQVRRMLYALKQMS